MTQKARLLVSVIVTCGLFLLSLLVSKTLNGVQIQLTIDDWTRFSLLHIRLPRTLLAFLAGGGYALSGVALQSYLRTPLADANLIGLGPFAALGSLFGLYLGLETSSSLMILASSFTLILPAIYAIFLRHVRTTTLVLLGISLTTFTQGLVSLLVYLVHQDFPLQEILFWLFGSFSHHTLDDILLLLPFFCFGLILLFWQRSAYNSLCLSDEMIFCAGINQATLGLKMIFAIALLLGPIIALSGMIGFLGVIVPHLTRLLFRGPPSQLLGPAFLIGGSLTLAADVLIRCLPLTYEINVGIVIALIAAPIFIHVIWRHAHA